MEPDAVEPATQRRAVSRDRVWVHALWEVLLAAGVVGAVLAVRHEDVGAFSGDGLRDLLVLLAAGILLGSAFALSLRAAVPNLAVGAVAVLAGVLTAWLRNQHGYELRVAPLVTLGAAIALGLAMAIVVVGFRLPAWAVGLGAAMGLYAAVLSMSAGRSLLLDGGPDLRRWAWPLAIGAGVLSLAGGALGLMPRTRAMIGRYRPAADPAAGRGGRAATTAAAALVGSCLLAAAAGLIIALRLRAVVPDDGLTLLAQAAAAAFLGGTSAYGRRGGLFGTVLAAAFLQLAALWLGLVEAQPWTRPALLGGAIVLGLLVGRLVEAAGSVAPPPAEEPADDEDDSGPDTQMWDPYSTGSFTPGADPYPAGGFTPAASYRPDAEPFWPGQAPAPQPIREPGREPIREPGREAGREAGREPVREQSREPQTARESQLGPYREPGRELGPSRDRDPGR